MLRKEDLLIRSICLKQDLKDERPIAEILNSSLDWDYILKQARENNLLPLAYRTLLNIKNIEEIVPPDFWPALKNAYYLTLKRNIIIFNMLESVAGLFKNEGIDIIIFKGPALIELAYKDMGIRPMADVDIFIKRNDLARIDAILKNKGYSPRYTFSYEHTTAIPIDLHWHITNLLPYHSSSNIIQKIDMGKIWNDSVEIKLGNTTLRTLSIYHQIICLCLHAFKHSYKPLMLLCDINEFLRVKKEKIDWDILIEEAFNLGLSKYVYYGLYLTSQIFKTDILQNAINKLKPKRMSLFEKKYINSILQGRPILRDSHSVFLVYFGMNETLTDRFLFLRNVLFPSQKYLSLLREKDVSCLDIHEYIRRVNIGLNCIAKFLLNRN
jgi:hypothetical protein